MQIKFIRYVLCLILVFSWIKNANAQESSTTTLSNLLNAVHTMQADFSQTITDKAGKKIQASYGRMALLRPGKFRWEVTNPMPQLILANDARLTVYDKDLQQVTVRSLKNAATEAPALLLSHATPVLDQDFVVTGLPQQNSKLAWYLLTAKKPESMFVAIRLGFLKQAISEMRLEDRLGHFIRIQFKHVVVNQGLPASLFIFKAPPKVDVVYETGQKS